VNFSIFSFKQEIHIAQVVFANKPQMKNSLNTQNHAHKKGTVVKWALPSLHGASLKITHTVPLSDRNGVFLFQFQKSVSWIFPI